MAITASPLYGSPVTMTITLAGLATAAGLDVGRESTAVDNATDDAIDCIVGGKLTTGTSPTASRQIEAWAYGSYDGTSYSGGATGSNAAFTPQEKSLLRLLAIIFTDGTSDKTYTWVGGSIAQAFGGVMPPKWGVFFTHNTGVNLNATAGNHEVKYTPVKYESS